NPGPGFHNHKWREFAFAIELVRDWKRLPSVDRERIITDPWAFATWVDTQPASAGRQFRHMLLYLLFPAYFERVVTSSHKERIARTFLAQFGTGPDNLDYSDRTAVDQAIFALRPRLERRYGSQELDFYLEPLRSHWLEPGAEGGDEEGEVPAATESADAAAWYHQRFGNTGFWVISAGEGARLWSQLRSENLIGIGWDYLGDLGRYGSRDEVHAAMQRHDGGNPTNSSLACWQFAHEIRQGDHLLVKQGRKSVLAHGIVESAYRYDDARSEYQHVRDITWVEEGPWSFPEGHGFPTKTLTEVTEYKPALERLFTRLDQAPARPVSPATGPQWPPYTRADAERAVFHPAERLSSILDALARKKNVILEGAPGVGKSYMARHVAWALLEAKDPTRVEMVQFHQSYSYEDFVQGWRPVEGGFELRDGVFHRFCGRAAKDPDNKYVFIIDEINRGNLSKVLGELMLLIEPEKRGSEYAIPLTYSRTDDERFFVPANVYVLGMMNTADRSLAMVDYALRRRFVFIRLEPAFDSDGFANALSEGGVSDELLGRIVARMTALNAAIRGDTQSLGPGYEIGHSFFVPDPDADAPPDGWYEDIVRYEITPQLREYWPDHPKRVDEQIARLLA
ncbi:MAG TPA: AAA family ATPase, partial [Longimicrobiaceae bacterium]|nr:AAA family ATPase [Longimicrobiaceae bacterium]